MRACYQRLRELLQRLWSPWSRIPSGRGSLDPGENIAFAFHAFWLVCVPIVAWMAIGQPPSWLVEPTLAILWTTGGFLSFMAGLPILILLVGIPLTALWTAFHRKTDEDREFEEEFDRRFDMMLKNDPQAWKLPWDDEFVAPKSFGIVPGFFSGLIKVFIHPPLPLLAGGVILIVALFAIGQPWLAIAYLAPWVLLRWILD